MNKKIDFNISHSGEYVICAIGKNVRIGIDVEEIKKTDLNNFKKVMTGEQWTAIHQSPEPFKTFFKYWTIKESVIKADSRGLSIPLLNIQIEGNIVNYDNQTWFLNEISVDSKYYVNLACDKNDINIQLIQIDFFEKINLFEELNSKIKQL